MAVAKIAITLEQDVLSEVDRLVRRHVFPNRSRAIQEAVREKVARLSVNRLAQECARLDPKAEQALAEFRGNVALNRSLKRGRQDAKHRRGAFV
jgi:Arc/MetJ-type ribon-helix-helix transcriptional regulator